MKRQVCIIFLLLIMIFPTVSFAAETSSDTMILEWKPKDLLTEKFIKDLYEVDTKIEALPNDNINIRFLPKHFK